MKRKGVGQKWLVGIVAAGVLIVGTAIAVPVLAQPRQPQAGVSAGVNLDNPTISRLATALGITPQALTDELKAGKSLAQIASENTKSESALVDALVAPLADRLALQVKYGYITQEQSQAALQNAQGQATAMLDRNLSTPASGTDSDGDGYYGCGDLMSNYFGSGNGFGPGMMGGFYGYNGQGAYGPGMMWGWGNGSVNPSIPSGSNNDSGATVTPGYGQNGYGMMGGGFGVGYGGMMRTW